MTEHEKRIREAVASGENFSDNDLRALLADLDEARAALSAAKAGGWLPIETAPKDGTEVLLLFSKAEYILGKPHGRVRAACWAGSGSSANWSIPYFKDDAPTAWQPLPAPPAQRGEG